MEGKTTLTRSNQITIPRRIVEFLQLHQGDTLHIRVTPEGLLEIEPIISLPLEEAKKLGYQKENEHNEKV